MNSTNVVSKVLGKVRGILYSVFLSFQISEPNKNWCNITVSMSSYYPNNGLFSSCLPLAWNIRLDVMTFFFQVNNHMTLTKEIHSNSPVPLEIGYLKDV